MLQKCLTAFYKGWNFTDFMWSRKQTNHILSEYLQPLWEIFIL